MLKSQPFGLKGFIHHNYVKRRILQIFLINTQKWASESFQAAFEKISTFLEVDLIQKELLQDSDARESLMSVGNIRTIVRKESILL